MNGYSLLSFGLGIAYIAELAIIIFYITPDFRTKYGIIKRLCTLAITLGTFFGFGYFVRDRYQPSFIAGLCTGILGTALWYIWAKHGILDPIDLLSSRGSGHAKSVTSDGDRGHSDQWRAVLVKLIVGLAFFLVFAFMAHEFALMHR